MISQVQGLNYSALNIDAEPNTQALSKFSQSEHLMIHVLEFSQNYIGSY